MFIRLLAYAGCLALVTTIMQWLQYQYFLNQVGFEVSALIIGLFCLVLGVYIGPKLVLNRPVRHEDAPLATDNRFGISDREFIVLRELNEGHSNKEIARRLNLSPNTIKTHITHIFDKLNVKRRTQALHKARALGLLN